MLVSVGIPFYNSEQTLADAIRSVFAQSWVDWELILVDDGSVDGSLEIALGIGDPRVRVIHDGENRGLPYRLNQIAALARGEYLARMDSDDWMHPERLAKQVAYLETHREVDVVGSNVYATEGNGQAVGVRSAAGQELNLRVMLEERLLVHPSVMGRTEWFRKNPYDEHFPRSEDHELWCRTCTNSRFAILAEPLLFYREVGVFRLRNYLLTGRTDRRIYRIYGPQVRGGFYTLSLVAKSYVKGVVYSIMTLLGKENALVKGRSRGLTRDEEIRAVEAMSVIRQTELPRGDSERIFAE